MADIRRIEPVSLPYAGRRVTPDTSRLGALMGRGGEQLAALSMQRGEQTARLLDRLGALFTGYRQMAEQKKATEMAFSQRAQERAEDMALQRDEMTARAAERAAVVGERTRASQEAEAAKDYAAAERVVNATRPGVVSPALYQVVAKWPDLAARFNIMDGAPVLMETGPQAAAREKAKIDADNITADNTRADAAERARRAHEERMARIAANRPTDAPERPSVWLTKGSESRYVTPSEAATMSTQGWKQPAGSEKPSSGLQKRTLAFFNRAAQADKDLEALESNVQKYGLMEQGRMTFAPNFAQTEEGQLYNQAQRAFTEARLRKDSGAAIPEFEFASDRQTYFPQPGDKPAALAQKRSARAAILSSLAFESGQALGEFLGDAEEANTLIQSYRERVGGGMAKPATGGGVKQWERGPDGKPRQKGGG